MHHCIHVQCKCLTVEEANLNKKKIVSVMPSAVHRLLVVLNIFEDFQGQGSRQGQPRTEILTVNILHISIEQLA